MGADRAAADLERFLAERGEPLLRSAVLLAGSREAGEDLLQAALGPPHAVGEPGDLPAGAAEAGRAADRLPVAVPHSGRAGPAEHARPGRLPPGPAALLKGVRRPPAWDPARARRVTACRRQCGRLTRRAAQGASSWMTAPCARSAPRSSRPPGCACCAAASGSPSGAGPPGRLPRSPWPPSRCRRRSPGRTAAGRNAEAPPAVFGGRRLLRWEPYGFLAGIFF